VPVRLTALLLPVKETFIKQEIKSGSKKINAIKNKFTPSLIIYLSRIEFEDDIG